MLDIQNDEFRPNLNDVDAFSSVEDFEQGRFPCSMQNISSV